MRLACERCMCITESGERVQTGIRHFVQSSVRREEFLFGYTGGMCQPMRLLII